MSEPDYTNNYSLTLVQVIPAGPAIHSLEAAAQLAGIHPEMLRYYCRLGLLGDARAQGEDEAVFDDDALYELCRLEHYRRRHGLSRKTLRLIAGLWREVERLQTELRFRRGL